MGRTGQFADGQQGRPQRLEVLGLDFGLEGRFQDFGEGRNDGRPVEHGLTGGGRFLADRSGDRHGQQSQKNKLQTTWQTEIKNVQTTATTTIQRRWYAPSPSSSCVSLQPQLKTGALPCPTRR